MKSIWQDNPMPHFPPLWGDIHTDVLVVGGGIAGLLCAHFLEKDGIRCAVAEAGTIAGGVTQNTTAKLTFQHGLIYRQLLDRLGPERAGLYLEANRQALEAYRELCGSIDCDFTEEDSFLFSVSDRDRLEEELSALIALGYPAEFAEGLPLPIDTAGAIKFPHQAQFHPLKFLSAIAEDLTVYENTPVRSLSKDGAVTDHGKIYAEDMIVATHFPFWNRHGSYFLKLYQQRSYVLALENAPPLGGMYLEERENGLSFRSHGGRLLLGGGGHRTGFLGGGWRELEDFAHTHYPDASVLCRWATQDCMSLDGIPYIGQYSARTPNLYVATGFNKWGMTSAMAAARILSDRISGKDNPYASLFSPSRNMLCPQLWSNAKEAVKHLLTVSPRRCTHMGCALQWNPQEHTWDCPCHGSRFEENGTLIENPATENLKKRG